MILQVFRTASDFLDKTQTYLLEDEASNNLMLGLALRLKRMPETLPSPPYLATVEIDGRLELAALMTPKSSLILFCPYKPNREACKAIAEDLKSKEWEVKGVNGPPELSKIFANSWASLTGEGFETKAQMNLFKLEKINWPEMMAPGRLCEAALEEIPLIEGWLYNFQREALNVEDQQELRFRTEDVIASHSLHVWVNDGQPVSMAAGRRPSPHGIAITMVYTPPELRKNGFASACVASLCQYYLDVGKSFCSLYADKENLSANRLYEKIGFRKIGEAQDIKFKPLQP